MKSLRLTQRTLAAILLVLVALGGLSVLKLVRQNPPPRAPMTLAVATLPLSALVYVAQEKGLFAREGLEVTLQAYAVGKDALDSVLNGRNQVCTVADTPLMFAGLRGEKLALIATIAEAKNYVNIVARKDRGIAGPLDLRGKTIGVRRETSGDYFLDAYLIFNGIPAEDIYHVDIKLEAMAEALANGELDAAVTWEPYRTAQQKRLGEKALVLTNTYIQTLQWNLVTSQAFAEHHLETITRLLRALIQARDYLRNHPNDARAIVARYLGDETITLTDYTFDINLQQNLLINLESQARWAIRNRLTNQQEVPDFLPLIFTQGLKSVDPEAVTVIQ